MQKTVNRDVSWKVIVNPYAGKGVRAKAWEDALSLLEKKRVPHETVFTAYRNHAGIIAAESIGLGCRKIISVGGDGTLNEVINGILSQRAVNSTDVTVAVIPMGTGNDWGRTYGLPRETEQLIELIRQGPTFVQDAGKIEYGSGGARKTRYFINMSGLGFDGKVADNTNAAKERGRSNRLSYIRGILLPLISFHPVPTQIIADGEMYQQKMFSAVVGIGQFNGGGMRQVPQAIPDDGYFDLTMIMDAGKWTIVANAKRLFDGSITEHAKVMTLRAKKITIEPDSTVMLEADGESLGLSPATFTVIPGSIRFCGRNFRET